MTRLQFIIIGIIVLLAITIMTGCATPQQKAAKAAQDRLYIQYMTRDLRGADRVIRAREYHLQTNYSQRYITGNSHFHDIHNRQQCIMESMN